MSQEKGLLDILSEIDCPFAQSFDSEEDVEWLFADRDCAAFLNWVINNVSRQNVVTQDQMDEYSKLKADGKILSGKKLRSAVGQSQNIIEPICSDEMMKKKVGNMEKVSAQLESTIQRLTRISRDLSVCEMQCRSKADGLQSVKSNLLEDFRCAILQCEADHEKFQNAVANCRSVIDRLYRFLTDESSPALVSHSDLKLLYSAEDEYTESLANFTDKRFYEGLSEISTIHQDDSYYDLLNLSDPSTLAIKGEDETTLRDIISEVHRLSIVHAVSLKQRIEAEVSSERKKVAVDYLQRAIIGLEDYASLSVEQLRNQLERVRSKADTYDRELSVICSNELPALIEKSSQSKEAFIIAGDYNLKLARQQYFLDCQDQVKDKLIDQRARNDLVVMLLEAEMEEVTETRTMLATVTAHLQNMVTNGRQRLATLADCKIADEKHDRTVVDSRDALLCTMDKLLERDIPTDGQNKLFATYDELAENASKLSKDYERLTQPDNSTRDLVKAMSRVCRDGVAVLFPSGTPSVCPDAFISTNIRMNTDILRDQLRELEGQIKHIMTTITQKKKLLRDR